MTVIVGYSKPINIVERKHLKPLINYLEPFYVLPSRQPFTKQIEKRYDDSKVALITDLQKVPFMALTCDMLTTF